MNITRELYRAENEDYKQNPISIALSTSAKISAAYLLNKYAGQVKLSFSEVQKLRFLSLQTIGGKPWFEALGKTATEAPTVREYALNLIKASEELLFKIPRAFSLSQVLSGRVFEEEIAAQIAKGALPKTGLSLASKDLIAQSEYLNIISEGKITGREISQGLHYREGKIFSSKGEELLHRAEFISGYWNKNADIQAAKTGIKTAREGFEPRYSKALYRRHGLRSAGSDYLITGGQDFFKAGKNKVFGLTQVGVENYMKLLDTPFEMVGKAVDTIAGPTTRLSGSLTRVQKLYDKYGLKDLFGVGGYKAMNEAGSSTKMLLKHFTRALPLIGAGVLAYKILDETLRNIPLLNKTILGGGIKGIPARLYQDSTLAYAHVSKLTGLTGLNKQQDEAAPGSTRLMGLLAFPTSFAIAGGTVGKLQDLYEKVPVGKKGPLPAFYKTIAQDLEGRSGTIGKLAKAARLTNVGRVGAYAKMGVALGAALVLPFLPGALGASKDPDELRNIYSGDQKVAVRHGQNWEYGVTDISGGDIKHFAPHWTVRAITDAGKKSRLGKHYGRPISRMLSLLADPYTLERDQDKDRPYMFWGASDYGFGFAEKLLNPLKQIFKPTILAHPEALGATHPAQMSRFRGTTPESLVGTEFDPSTRNYVPDVQGPSTINGYISGVTSSFRDMMGLMGFSYGSVLEKMSGSRGAFTPEAEYETSGRIMSAQRSFWDQDFGGMGTLSEPIRRMIAKRDYGTEYVQAAVRNTMPDWLPKEFQFGDAFSQVELGEYLLPGRGYEELYPEMKGVDYEDYSSVHKMNVLSNVARMTPEYYRAKYETETAIKEDRLNKPGRDLYEELMRQDEVRQEDEGGRFDYGEGIAGSYYLGLKKLGRELPTEHLYPLAPINKFSGPVDPYTEYKSTVLLDKQFKVWSNPVSDYAKPTYNYAMDILTLGHFTPRETKEHRDVENYFEKLQYAKNQYLEEHAKTYSSDKNYEAANFIRSGKRPTIYDSSPFDDQEDLARFFGPREGTMFKAFANMPQSAHKKILRAVSPEMQEALKGQWTNNRLSDAGEFDKLQKITKATGNIGGSPDLQEMTQQHQIPDRDFIGYAPGVDLNAFKVKTVSQLGKNIRDFNLWKEDERQARLLDVLSYNSNISTTGGDFMEQGRERQKHMVSKYFKATGTNPVITATPTMGRSTVEFHGTQDNKENIRRHMQAQGMIVY